MKKIIKINNVDFTDICTPTGYTVTYRRTRGPNAGDLMDGGYVDDVLSVKAVINYPCMPTNEEQLSRILTAVLQDYVSVYFYDPWTKGYRTAVMLPSDPTQKFRGTGVNSLDYWTGTVLQFTERDGGVKKNKLVYNGKDYTELESASSILEDSIALDELPVDTMTAVVRDYSLEDYILSAQDTMAGVVGRITLPLSADGYLIGDKLDALGLKNYKYGEIVQLFHDNTLIGKFYLELIKRIGRTRWKFNATSGIGLLMSSLHWGGMYSGESLSSIVSDIIGGVVPYEINPVFGDTPIYGWLEKGTRRDNLRNVLFAAGGRVRKNANGDISIIPYTDDTPYEIGQEKFYLSGASVSDGTPATQVLVTEHSYFALPTDEEITLHDGEAPAAAIVTPKGRSVNGIIVDFSEPIHDLSVTGSTILESGVNYAVLSNSAYTVLKGKRYNHTERVVSKTISATGTPNVVSSSSCHLVNFTNSDNVANRLAAYYGSDKTVETDIIVSTQKPGDYVSFRDPFGDSVKGYIASLDTTFSNTLKARASIITGFVPPPQTTPGTFSNEVILTGSGTWTVPSGIYQIRYVLFSGAQGGRAGKQGGTAGGSKAVSYNTGLSKGLVNVWSGPGGTGGSGGSGGQGSKIFNGRMTVTPGQMLSYSCGVGGAGAAYSAADNPGSEGGATTLNGASSNSGSYPSASGWVDILTGKVYAQSGQSGLPGGNGAGYVPNYDIPSGASSLSVILKFTEATAAVDEDGVSWSGGSTLRRSGYADVAWYDSYPSTGSTGTYHGTLAGYGMAPGGAAGAAPASEVNQHGTYSYTSAMSINGVAGRTPAKAPKKPALTIGGRGGYGGGGGSVAGWSGYEAENGYTGGISATPGSPGPGGNGGTGGQGGDGMIIIYY